MKTITIYELLGMIKDNRAPEKIRIFDGTVFKYYEPSRHYYTKDKNSLLKILDEYRGDVFDKEVEILEEEKKIPEKLDWKPKESMAGQLTQKEQIEVIARRTEKLKKEFNNLLDYLKSKGE